jgi:hypothetical protein
MSKRNKWWLLYLAAYNSYGELAGKIVDKEFDSELDMLVWASTSRIPRALGHHFVVSPDGLTRLPVEIYERIEHLKREQSHREALAEERAIAKKEQMLRERREARQRKQEARAQ